MLQANYRKSEKSISHKYVYAIVYVYVFELIPNTLCQTNIDLSQ